MIFGHKSSSMEAQRFRMTCAFYYEDIVCEYAVRVTVSTWIYYINNNNNNINK